MGSASSNWSAPKDEMQGLLPPVPSALSAIVTSKKPFCGPVADSQLSQPETKHGYAMPAVQSPFPSIADCDIAGRDDHAIAADLDGTLIVSRCSFPYFFLLASKAGSLFHAAVLLLSPVIFFVYKLASKASMGICQEKRRRRDFANSTGQF